MTRLRPDGTDAATGDPCWQLVLGRIEAQIVSDLPDRLESVLTDPDLNGAVIDRLFPACYTDEAEERENRQLLGDALLDQRREMLDEVRHALGAARCTDEGSEVRIPRRQLDVWMRFVNDARMILATDLGIVENMDAGGIEWTDPRAPQFALLEYLGGLEMLLLSALAPDIPTSGFGEPEDGEPEDDEPEDVEPGDGEA